ncbi:alcohol dehydrogenase catalytic domain-containing protein [Saccharopolyspora sp. 5N708]|uniref:alcohol dehydrogenase catalytic domain-containing protein n=1 Tax=Saccharopolyspora sp. 5N708 TaxID=3457424 RepID=UPI003FD10722
MRAAYVERLGGVDEIRVGELPEPVAGPGDVLVDVVATSANPVDTFVRSGLYVTPVPLPLALGRDVVGRVASDAVGFRAGEWVWCNSLGHDGRQGAAAERAAVLPIGQLVEVQRQGHTEPYEDTARRKIVPETLEQRVLTAFRDGDGGAAFRKTSCAVAYGWVSPTTTVTTALGSSATSAPCSS